MAHHVVSIELLHLSDDNEEDINIIPPLQPILLANNNERNELRVLHPILGLIVRIEHIKVQNYIENIVTNYVDKDFIMHFRLSRVVAYELIENNLQHLIYSMLYKIVWEF